MASFLQSPEWQEIQERMGRPTFRISGVLAVRHDLTLGFRYLYLPRPGALPDDFWTALRSVAERSGATFVKIDPELPIPAALPSVASHALQPTTTITVDCCASRNVLLNAMHPKTRYNIRLAERHGITVTPFVNRTRAGVLDEFLHLLQHTAARDGFSPHRLTHYRTILEFQGHDFSNELWIAAHRGHLVAGAIVNWFRPSGTATYLHGASDYGARSLMAPHLLHWRLMTAAQERGYATYDLGGIDEARLPGVSRFKTSFGGTVRTFPASRDYVLQPLSYMLYRTLRTIRRCLT